MKFNGSLALGLIAAFAISAVASSAYAAGGLFDLLGKTTTTRDDGSFFGGQALTFGDLSSTSLYAGSDVMPSYSECASCAGNADAATFAFDGAVVYDNAFAYDFGYDYGFDYAPYTRARCFTPVRTTARVVGGALRSIREFLFGYGYSYCQPAYVCDPCWSVCDPCWSPCADFCEPAWTPVCDPCAPSFIAPGCDACAPNAVYAPRSCCGDGYIPGSVTPLDAETGKANRTGFENQDSPNSPNPQPAQSLSTGDDNLDAPALPTYDDLNGLPPANNDAPETVPTPAPSPESAGLIKMLVPEDAIVYVNGYRTKQKGALRSFAAKNLEYGQTYSFEIRVVEFRNGQRYEDVQTTTLTAGESTALAFNPTLAENQAYAVR
ncbi:MAG: TIGR03000 domain-containing protein [Planctomycetia bacterium]|nr:TIGR03000 domain-containing protein [Planctomycetia bacterium]